ncbi:MAG TPA: indole-3-glycerol phosphate synthase TrpC [Pseudoneobacillus sp.]|nr:indole-3-glycerol phosphate synthase TrpC [Pseudoneobacillus sp.]
MGTILERILAEKKMEIKNLKELDRLTYSTFENDYSLIKHLELEDRLTVIAEYKRASPSKGNINITVDPVRQAKLYQQNGAAAISVLTDSSFFKGSFQDLKAVRESVNIPILCKDFIIDNVQIDFAKAFGANIILLIAAALTANQLMELYDYAKQKNLEVLVEVHDEADLEKALLCHPRLVGINNRNLKTFEVNLEVTERLIPFMQSFSGFIVSESGIFSRSDAQRVRNAGVNAVLVGEALMKSKNLSKSIHDLRVSTLREVKNESENLRYTR